MPDGSRLHLLSQVPVDAADRRLLTRHSVLYGILGVRVDLPEPGILGGYVGKTASLHTARADTSYTHWVIANKAIRPTGMVLLRAPHTYHPDLLSLIESRVLARLSTDLGMLALTNTHTSAETAVRRLAASDLTAGISLADQIAYTIWARVLHHRSNPWPAPAPNAREAANRIVMIASNQDRMPLTLRQIVERLDHSGHPSLGKTRWRSVLRDMCRREQDTGFARVHAFTHRGRILFRYETLTETEAIRNYEHAHQRRAPRPRRTAADDPPQQMASPGRPSSP
jgi:hypothetical protein